MHCGLERLVALPVAVGFLDDDAAFDEQTLDDQIDVEARILGVPDAQSDVLEVAE